MARKMTIVENSYLSKKLAEKNLTIKEFANRFGVCRPTVYKWIQDIDTITVRDARWLCSYLSCSLTELIGEDGDSAIFVAQEVLNNV